MSTTARIRDESDTPHPPGFTLLEMLLVLAILVAITAATIPVLERMYDAHRIRQAAMEVRTALSAARLRAIDGGVSFACYVEPDGQHLVILPHHDQGLRFGDTETPSSPAQPPAATSIHVELSHPLYFWTDVVPRQRPAADALRQLDRHQDSLAGHNWSEPIVFAPNGSCTDATFEIRDRQGRAVEVDVRGLTGTASATMRTRRRGT